MQLNQGETSNSLRKQYCSMPTMHEVTNMQELGGMIKGMGN